jgi:hypothetical protein
MQDFLNWSLVIGLLKTSDLNTIALNLDNLVSSIFTNQILQIFDIKKLTASGGNLHSQQ